MRFENREDAGIQLSTLIIEKNTTADYIVTIPRGGVPVAKVLSNVMHLPLRLCLIRKLGHPINPEFAIGAVSENDCLIHNHVFINNHHPEIKSIIEKERKRIHDMKIKFGHEFTFKEIKQKKIILVDDGIATGACIELAIKELRTKGARSIIIATPVCPFNTYQYLKQIADDTICCVVAQQFAGISSFYHDFTQVSDEHVLRLLNEQKQKKEQEQA